MGEYTERWRRTHNWLAEFGDDILSLRDLFKAAGEAEDLLARKDAVVAGLDARTASLANEIDVQTLRLVDQTDLVAQADADLDRRVDTYRLAKMNDAEVEVQREFAQLRTKAHADLAGLIAEIINKAANRDALVGEVADAMARAQALDHEIAEKGAKVKALDERLAAIGKFALGATDG